MATSVRPLPRVDPRRPAARSDVSALRNAGVLLGTGVGGFIDGIVFHMLLQWHHVVCVNCGTPFQTVEDLRLEIFFDGLFHVLTLGLVVAGLFMLWRAVRRFPSRLPPRFLVGALILGWGLFNLVEGVLDHQILGIHHVKPGPGQELWDLAFLASGVLLAFLGAWILRAARADRDVDPSEVHP